MAPLIGGPGQLQPFTFQMPMGGRILNPILCGKAPLFCGAYAAPLIGGSGVPKIWEIELSDFEVLTWSVLKCEQD